MRLRARFLHSAGFQPFSVEMTEGNLFDCAEKTGLPKIAAQRDFWEEEEPPCKSSILPISKMLTAQACDDELRVTGEKAERAAPPVSS